MEGGHANATSIEQTTRAATAMRAHASLALGVSAAACARAKVCAFLRHSTDRYIYICFMKGNGGQRRQFAHDAMVALRNAARLHVLFLFCLPISRSQAKLYWHDNTTRCVICVADVSECCVRIGVGECRCACYHSCSRYYPLVIVS